MSGPTAAPPAFRDAARLCTEVHSTMLAGESRATFVTADRVGRVVLQHCGADLALRVTMPAAEARALAAELLVAAGAAEKVAA